MAEDARIQQDPTGQAPAMLLNNLSFKAVLQSLGEMHNLEVAALQEQIHQAKMGFRQEQVHQAIDFCQEFGLSEERSPIPHDVHPQMQDRSDHQDSGPMPTTSMESGAEAIINGDQERQSGSNSKEDTAAIRKWRRENQFSASMSTPSMESGAEAILSGRTIGSVEFEVDMANSSSVASVEANFRGSNSVDSVEAKRSDAMGGAESTEMDEYKPKGLAISGSSQFDGGGMGGGGRGSIFSVFSRSSDQRMKLQAQAQSVSHRSVRQVPFRKSHTKGAVQQYVTDLVRSNHFEAFFAAMILTNAISMGVRVNLRITNLGEREHPAVFVLEYLYTALFTVELVLRVLADGKRTFHWQGGWFFLDFFVVFTSLLEVVLDHTDDGSDLANMSNVRMFRVIRVVRILKVVRVARLMRFIRALRKLALSIIHTLRTVMWACLLLNMIIFVFALTFVQALTPHMETHKFSDMPSDPSYEALQLYWGSLPSAMLTLYKSIADGIGWHIVIVPLQDVSIWLVLLFLVYITFTVFAVLNVITGVFCEAAMESARLDYELMVQTHLKEKDNFTDAIYSAFGIAKEDGKDLELSYQEFEDVFSNPKTQAYLAAIELESSDAWELFKLLDTDGSALVDVDEFVTGCLRLKGVAKAIDIAKLNYDSKIRQKRLYEFMKRTEDSLHELQSSLDQPWTDLQASVSLGPSTRPVLTKEVTATSI